MKHVLKQAITACAPKFLVGALLERIDDPKIIPSPSFARWNEFTLDLSIIEWRRSLFKRGRLRYLLSDSTQTKRGHDWFWMECFEVQREDLRDVVKAMFSIKSMLDASPPAATYFKDLKRAKAGLLYMPTLAEDPTNVSAELKCACRQLNKVQHYIYTPCAMASGFTSTVHKSECMLHGWHFDLPHSETLDEYR